MSIPPHYKLLYSPEMIHSRVVELAKEIYPWITDSSKKTGQEVIAMPLLRGAIFFFADLSREIQSSIEVNPIRVSSYQGKDGNQASNEVSIDSNNIDVHGKSVLLIDDICDSGRTLEKLVAKMHEGGASEVKTVVLIKRELVNTFQPDWCGFRHTGHEWFVGYGMDDREGWRNLPGIYVLNGN